MIPPLITFAPHLVQDITDIARAVEGEAGEAWALRIILLATIAALAFVGKWALSLPRKSEVDTLRSLNSDLREEWREERAKREKAERRETLLRMQVLKLEMIITSNGGTPPLIDPGANEPDPR